MKSFRAWFYLVSACALLTMALGTHARAEMDASSCLELPLPASSLPEELRTTAEGAVQTRVALVIGNSAYRHIAALRNPGNDAEAVAYSFQRLGFQTVLLLDATADVIVGCKDHLLTKYPEADVGVLYYAGHGIQVDDTNYLLGVDASQAEGVSGLVDVTELVEQFQRGWKATLVFLDACRDNPYGDDRPQGLSPSTARGAVRIAHTGELNTDPRIQAIGAFIAYSTSPNATATDGAGNMSPFAAAFAEAVISPGISVQEVMADVSRDVAEETGWTQTPWTRSSLEVALRLAGNLTASEAKATSDVWASRSRALLMSGDRLGAIAEALKGIPFFPQPGTSYEYQEAWNALTNAYRSTAFQLDVQGTDSVVFSSDLTRALLVRFAGDRAARVELWNTETASLISEIFQYDGDDMFRLGIVNPVFSGDSSRFASIIGKGRVGIWNSSDGSIVRIIDKAIKNEYEWDDSPRFERIDLNNTGEHLLASGGGFDYAVLWNVDSGSVDFIISKDELSSAFKGSSFLERIRERISNFVPENCSLVSSYAAFLDSSTIGVSCLYPVSSQYAYVIILLDYPERRVASAVAMDAGFSIGDSRKNLDYSINSDRSIIFTSGSQNITSSGEIHIYNIQNGRQILKKDNPNHMVGVFSKNENIVSTLSVFGSDIIFYNAESGDIIDNSNFIPSNNFVATPSLFSSEGRLIGVDYSQLGRGVWEIIPEAADLEPIVLDQLTEEQRISVEAEKLRFWTAESAPPH